MDMDLEDIAAERKDRVINTERTTAVKIKSPARRTGRRTSAYRTTARELIMFMVSRSRANSLSGSVLS